MSPTASGRRSASCFGSPAEAEVHLKLGLWLESRPVAWEEPRVPDVGGSGQLRHPPLEGHSEAAVRRHPVPEGLEVAAKRLRAEAARRERVDVVGVPVQTLAAREQLDAAEVEVEAPRERGPVRIRM